MKYLQIFLFFTIFFLGMCSAFTLKARIMDGFETTIEENPWQVRLITGLGRSRFCGGSIIGRKWILTARHCTMDIPVDDLSVRIGSTFWRTGGTVHKIVQKYEHEKVDQIFANYDFSLLEMAEPIEFNESIQSITLPAEDLVLQLEMDCLVSGWGRPQANGTLVERLRATYTRVYSHEKCKEEVGSRFTESMICSGKAVARGDSGGPLMCKINGIPLLIGVASWHYNNVKNQTDIESIYSDILSARLWIQSITGI